GRKFHHLFTCSATLNKPHRVLGLEEGNEPSRSLRSAKTDYNSYYELELPPATLFSSFSFYATVNWFQI
ncbi:hypothetical protein RYX36_016312, partial [Vicia faba]